ncbi:hypothetical protein SHA02_09510 [Salisediminibacterium halotolerans]|nr:hypothetical protein SHA02_09510 [Salisediminibacterium halotolerans]
MKLTAIGSRPLTERIDGTYSDNETGKDMLPPPCLLPVFNFEENFDEIENTFHNGGKDDKV